MKQSETEPARSDWGFVETLGQREEFKRGAVVVAPNDIADKLYYVARGRAKYMVLASTGVEKVLTLIEPGEVFGWGGVFGHLPFHLWVIAMEDCVVFTLGRSELEKIILHDPRKAIDIMADLAKRVYWMVHEIENIVFCSPEQRLLQLLDTLSRQHGRREGEDITIQLRLTHEEIGNIVGVTRVTVTRLLSKFRQEGVIAMKDRKIRILRRKFESHYKAMIGNSRRLIR